MRSFASMNYLFIILVFEKVFLNVQSKTGNYSLRIILGDLTGSQRYAQYDNFRVGPEKVGWLGG